MTKKHAAEIQDKTIKEVIAFVSELVDKEVTEQNKRQLLAKMAAAYLPVVQTEAERARQKLAQFKKKYGQTLLEFESEEVVLRDADVAEEHEDWVEWSHWDHILTESLGKIKILEEMIYQHD